MSDAISSKTEGPDGFTLDALIANAERTCFFAAAETDAIVRALKELRALRACGMRQLQDVIDIAKTVRAAETKAEPDPRGLAVVRAAQLDLAAKTLDRHDCHTLGIACREAAALLREFAVKSVAPHSCRFTGPNGCDSGNAYECRYADGKAHPCHCQCHDPSAGSIPKEPQ